MALDDDELYNNKPARAVPLASARQHPETQKENQAGHSSERVVGGQGGLALGSQPGGRGARVGHTKRLFPSHCRKLEASRSDRTLAKPLTLRAFRGAGPVRDYFRMYVRGAYLTSNHQNGVLFGYTHVQCHGFESPLRNHDTACALRGHWRRSLCGMPGARVYAARINGATALKKKPLRNRQHTLRARLIN